jgi:hypothetical protein
MGSRKPHGPWPPPFFLPSLRYSRARTETRALAPSRSPHSRGPGT